MNHIWILSIITFLTVCVNAQRLHPHAEQLKTILDDGLLKRSAEYVKENEEYLSTKCGLDILAWSLSPTKFWALKMHDATGKFPSGLLRVNVYSIGQYDECMTINEEVKIPTRRIKGKYCMLNFGIKDLLMSFSSLSVPQNSTFVMETIAKANILDQIPNFYFNLGICIPHSCSVNDMKDIIGGIIRTLNVTIDAPEIFVNEDQCAVAGETDTEWDTVDVIAVCVFSFFGALLLFSTVYDTCTRDSLKESPIGHELLIAFSMYSNGKKLVKPNNSPSAIKCINGIRVFSILWIILCHRYSTSTIFPLRNWIDIVSWIKTSISTIIVGGSVAVDTFFLLSGILLAYVFFNQAEKKKNKKFNIVLFYLHRLFRLWPASAAIIFFTATLFRHLGDGPYWPQISEHMEKSCQTNWWQALFYLSNYINVQDQCVQHLWYLGVDFQLYVLSPILLLPLLLKPTIGVINMIFWIIAQQVALITIVYLNDWGISMGPADYMKKYYFPTHMRAAPWLIGFATGYILHKIKGKTFDTKKISTWLFAITGWLLSFAALCAVIFGQKPLSDPFSHVVSKGEDGTFNAFARTGWALALSWVVFACHHGLGGPINWFLSLYYWEVVAKLSYSMYLTHVTFQMWYSGSLRTISEFSHFPFIYIYFADIVMTVMAAFFWAMAFEFPFINLERILFFDGKSKTPTKEVKMDIPQEDKVVASNESLQNQIDPAVSEPSTSKDQLGGIYPSIDTIKRDLKENI